MKKELTKSDVDAICAWIEEQTVKVKWPAIKEACPSVTGKEFSIVALRRPDIVTKRADKNERIALGEIADIDELPSPRSRVRNLTARASVLSMQNDNLAGQIVRWTYNANRMGYSFEELDRTLPPALRPTREQHERRILDIENKTRRKVEKQIENERAIDAKTAERNAKRAEKALRKAEREVA